MIAISDVVKSIEAEKESIQKHINALEEMLENAVGVADKIELYKALSPKLTKYYSLLQKHNEQLLDAIELSGSGKDNVPSFDE